MSIKKFLPLILIPILIFNTVYAAFLDVDSGTEVGTAVSVLADRGVISGYGNGLFGPDNSLTRAEAVKVINKIFGYTLAADISFSDVHEGDWFYSYVAAAVNAGYISGYPDGTFRPNEALTKEQICVMLDKIMNFILLPTEVYVADPISDWAYDSVIKIISNYLADVDDDGCFHATEVLSRGNFCLILEQFALEKLPEIEPFDLSSIAKDELNQRLGRIIYAVRNELCTKTDEPEIIRIFNLIADNMEAYVADSSYDYKTGAENAKKQYDALPSDLRTQAKNLLLNFFTDDKYFDDVQILYDFFF